jgi:DNA-binding IclR family transcriptional regulator
MSPRTDILDLVSTKPAPIPAVAISKKLGLAKENVQAVCNQLKGKHFMEGATA